MQYLVSMKKYEDTVNVKSEQVQAGADYNLK